MRDINLENLTFMDPAVQDCPYPAYEVLRAEAPAFYDRAAGIWVITKYADIRSIIMNPAAFSSEATVELARDSIDPDRAERLRDIYRAEGWEPQPTLSLLDEPRHAEVRAIFTRALRAGKIKALDPFIESVSHDLVDRFVDKGECEIVAQYSVPLPLIAICSQVGVPIDDVWQIKAWTDAWMRRFSLMISEEEEIECIRKEIEFQKYFHKIVADIKQHPNDSILSDLANTKMSDGRELTYAEVSSHLLSDIFVGGSETSTNAISEGVLIMCQNPDHYALLNSDIDKYLPTFIEEVLRLQSPVQSLYRVTREAVEIGGVEIPARSVLSLRFGAGNRDKDHFERPDAVDLLRCNAGAHMSFGGGIHHCIGAPLARREMYWAFRTLLDRTTGLSLAPGKNDFSHHPGMMLRSLKELHVRFRRR